MACTREDWIGRIGARMDITARLTHLTRRPPDDPDPAAALDVLMKILAEGRLIGSSTQQGFIVGPRRAVCFQDAPLYAIAQNIRHEAAMQGKVRYDHFGLAFAKDYVFARGGRPVIYDRTADAKRYLPEEQWWRIVCLDLGDPASIVDWTHEREWRVPDDFAFDVGEAFVLVPNREGYHAFLRHPAQRAGDFIERVAGIVTLSPVFC